MIYTQCTRTKSLILSLERVSLAIGRHATQSTQQGEDHHASIAVDGETYGSLSTGTQYSQTQSKPRQWWMVDLGASFAICSVTLWSWRKNLLPQ